MGGPIAAATAFFRFPPRSVRRSVVALVATDEHGCATTDHERGGLVGVAWRFKDRLRCGVNVAGSSVDGGLLLGSISSAAQSRCHIAASTRALVLCEADRDAEAEDRYWSPHRMLFALGARPMYHLMNRVGTHTFHKLHGSRNNLCWFVTTPNGS